MPVQKGIDDCVGGLLYDIMFGYLVEERPHWIRKAKGKIYFPGFNREN